MRVTCKLHVKYINFTCEICKFSHVNYQISHVNRMWVTCELYVNWFKFHMWYISNFTCELSTFACKLHTIYMWNDENFACDTYRISHVTFLFSHVSHIQFACELTKFHMRTMKHFTCKLSNFTCKLHVSYMWIICKII